MEKIIEIDGKKISFKATANTPRLYRIKFRRDLMKDMLRLASQHKKRKFDIPDLEVFENIAYIMALQCNPQIGSIDAWLDSFKMFDVYEILPQILELWSINMETQTVSKKNLKKVAQSR